MNAGVGVVVEEVVGVLDGGGGRDHAVIEAARFVTGAGMRGPMGVGERWPAEADEVGFTRAEDALD